MRTEASAPPAALAPPTEWTPTHRIPDGGLIARERPHPDVPALLRIKAGEEVQVIAVQGAWNSVAIESGWTAWVDGRKLDIISDGWAVPPPPF